MANVTKLPGKGSASPKSAHEGPADGEDWFEDRQTLGSKGGGGHDDGESIWLVSYADMMTLLFGFFVLLSSFSKIDMEEFEKARKETTLLFGGEYQKSHLKLEEELKKTVQAKGPSDQIHFDNSDSGISITFRGSLFFDSGSAEVRQDALDLIQQVIPNIKSQNQRFNVIVEGHTDDNSINTERFPSNWELSSQRASAVLRLFEASGFDRANLRAIGYADTVPVLPNRDDKGNPIPENQTQNRRVVIKLLRAPASN